VEIRAFRGSLTFLKFGLTLTKFFVRISASKFPSFVRQKRQDKKQFKPMKGSMMNIKKTISDWAKNIFSGSSCGYEATIEELPSAPPFLFTDSTGAGYCVTIQPAASICAESKIHHSKSNIESPSLGFWIPTSGKSGSQVAFREGDEEIYIHSIDWLQAWRTDAATGEQAALANDDALVENLTSLFAEFLRDEILLPSLEKHLDEKGIAHEIFTIDMVGGIEPWDEKNWSFLFLPAEPIPSTHYHLPDTAPSDWSTSRVIGLTGDGRAAFFSYSRHEVEPRGYVDHINLESQITGIDSPAAIHAWLEETISANAA
jgi:hypothetical protein